MSRMFGSNLPPGCTTRHIEEAMDGRDPTPEEDQILEMLEHHGVPTEINDKIMAIVGKLTDTVDDQAEVRDNFCARLKAIEQLPVHPIADVRNHASLKQAKRLAAGDDCLTDEQDALV